MNKKNILGSVRLILGLFVGVVLTVVFLWSIFPKEPVPVALRILGDSFSGYSTFRDLEFQKFLKKSQISLTYEDEPDQQKRSQKLKLGNADLIVTTLDQFIKQNSYSSGKIVGLIDRSNGADAVVVNTKKYPKLSSLADLRQFVKIERTQGRQPNIAFAVDTPSEFLAITLTAQEKFKLSDFKIIEKDDSKKVWRHLQDSQNVPIAVLWEPYVTQAQKNGYTVIFSSKNQTTAIIDVIVASNILLQSQPDVVSQFLAAYYNRIHARAFDPSLMEKQIKSEDNNLSSDDAKAIREGIQFFTVLDAEYLLNSGMLEDQIKNIISLLLIAEKIPKKPQNWKEFFTSQYISKSVTEIQDVCMRLNPLTEIKDRICNTSSNLIISKNPSPNPNSTSYSNTLLTVTEEQILGEVKFDEGSNELPAQSKQTLNELTEKIQKYDPKLVIVRVRGHSSRTGGNDRKQKVSDERARVVSEYLKKAIKEYKIQTEGKSDYLPIPSIPRDDSRQSRAEIRLIPRQ